MTTTGRGRWIVLTAVSLGLLLATIDTSILYIAVPVLEQDLGASTSQSLWIINTYPLVMTGLLLGTGTLGDRCGHKHAFQIGIVLVGAASLVAAFSPSPEVLIFARAFLAVGAALMLPATLAIFRVTFHDERERNIAIVVWSSISIGGIAFGPLLGGLLLEQFRWESVFLFNVLIVLITFVLAAIYAPKPPADTAVPWDPWSSLLALARPHRPGRRHQGDHPPDRTWVIVAISLVVAVVGFAAFVHRQGKLCFVTDRVARDRQDRLGAAVRSSTPKVASAAGAPGHVVASRVGWRVGGRVANLGSGGSGVACRPLAVRRGEHITFGRHCRSAYGVRPVTRALGSRHQDEATMDMTVESAKAAARILRADLAARNLPISYSAALELVAHQLGLRDWNTASAILGRRENDTVGVGAPVPVLRVQRVDDVRAFYLDFLGFTVEWEHRFESSMPLYARLVRDDARLDLSEHHGDGTPGSVVWIGVRDVYRLHAELEQKRYPSQRPGVEPNAPGGPTLDVTDPSGNSLRFCQSDE